jgi:hypothetical protein
MDRLNNTDYRNFAVTHFRLTISKWTTGEKAIGSLNIAALSRSVGFTATSIASVTNPAKTPFSESTIKGRL